MDRPREMCPECGGSGATYDGEADCGVCNGLGWVYAPDEIEASDG